MLKIFTFKFKTLLVFALMCLSLQVFASDFEKIKRLAEMGNIDAQFTLALMYDNGKGVQQDDKEAVKWYRKAAEQGNAGAQFNLGLMYADGEGVLQDYKAAAKWYREAAEQGDALSQYLLGLLYDMEGEHQDYKEAVKWYRKAAEQGLADAQFLIGSMYAKGEGVLENYNAAYAWTSLAVYNGYKFDLNDFPYSADKNKAQALAKRCLESDYKDCP